MEFYSIIETSILNGGEIVREEGQSQEVASVICEGLNNSASGETYFYVSKQASI